MKSIEALKNLFKKNIEDQAEKIRTLSNMKMTLESKRSEAEQAAVDGNYEKYHAIHEEIRALEDQIYVMDIHSKNILQNNAVSEDEIMDAWKDYEKSYRNRFQKAMTEYQKHRNELYKEFSALVDLQNEAIAMRDDCGMLAGMSADTHEDEVKIANKYSMEYIPNNAGTITMPLQGGGTMPAKLAIHNLRLEQPDALFFLAVNGTPESDMDKFCSVILGHKHCQG